MQAHLKECIDVLKRTKEVLDVEEKWTQNVFSCYMDGETQILTEIESPKARCFCLQGAIARAAFELHGTVPVEFWLAQPEEPHAQADENISTIVRDSIHLVDAALENDDEFEWYNERYGHNFSLFWNDHVSRKYKDVLNAIDGAIDIAERSAA